MGAGVTYVSSVAIDTSEGVGRDIKYDAAASDAERKKSVEEWKKMIPRGQLPLKEKPKP